MLRLRNTVLNSSEVLHSDYSYDLLSTSKCKSYGWENPFKQTKKYKVVYHPEINGSLGFRQVIPKSLKFEYRKLTFIMFLICSAIVPSNDCTFYLRLLSPSHLPQSWLATVSAAEQVGTCCVSHTVNCLLILLFLN